MDTISSIDYILQKIGNLGGVVAGLWKEGIGFIEEHELAVTGLALLMLLILILWPK